MQHKSFYIMYKTLSKDFTNDSGILAQSATTYNIISKIQ